MYKEMLENYRNIVSVMTANGIDVPQETIAILGICLCGAQKEGCKVIVNEKKEDKLIILVDGSTYEFNSDWYEKIMKSVKQQSEYQVVRKPVLDTTSDKEEIPVNNSVTTSELEKDNSDTVSNEPEASPVNNDFRAIGDTEADDCDAVSHFTPQKEDDEDEDISLFSYEDNKPEKMKEPEDNDNSLIVDDDSPIIEEPKVVKAQQKQVYTETEISQIAEPTYREKADENEAAMAVLLKLLQKTSSGQETKGSKNEDGSVSEKDYAKIKEIVDQAVQDALQSKLSAIQKQEIKSVKEEEQVEIVKNDSEFVTEDVDNEPEKAPELIPDEDEEILLPVEEQLHLNSAKKETEIIKESEDSDNEELLISIAAPVVAPVIVPVAKSSQENKHLTVEEIKNNLRAQRNKQILDTIQNHSINEPEVDSSQKIEEFSSEDIPEEIGNRIIIPEMTGEAIKIEQDKTEESKPVISKDGEERIGEDNLYYDKHEISFINADNQKELGTILIYPLNKDTSLSAAPIVAVANFNGKIRTEIMQSGGLAVLDFETFALSARGRWIGTGFQSLIKQYNGKISEFSDNVKKNESEIVPGFIKKTFDGEEFYIFPAAVINNLNGMCPLISINMSNQIHGKNGTIKYSASVSDMNGFVKCNTSLGSHMVNAYWNGIPGKNLSLNVKCK